MKHKHTVIIGSLYGDDFDMDEYYDTVRIIPSSKKAKKLKGVKENDTEEIQTRQFKICPVRD